MVFFPCHIFFSEKRSRDRKLEFANPERGDEECLLAQDREDVDDPLESVFQNDLRERGGGCVLPGTAFKAWHVSATLNARHAAFNAYGLRSHRRWTSRYGSGGRWWLWGVFGFCFCWEEMWRGSLISAHILGGWMFFFCFFLLGIFNDLLGMYVIEHTARL